MSSLSVLIEIVREASSLISSRPDQLAEIIARFEPLLARTYRDGLLAEWLSAARDSIKPIQSNFPKTPLDESPPLRPPFGPEGFGESKTPEPVVQLPLIERAAQDLYARGVVTQEELLALDQDARRTAFTLARTQSLETIKQVRDALADNVRDGGTLKDFRDRVSEVLDGTPLSPSQLETTYRTQAAQAYSAGQRAIIENPMVIDEFPYLLWSATHDSRVRPDHLEMETHGQNGTAVYRVDDPIWEVLYPPAGYNCFLPGTEVSGDFFAGTRSFYDGQAVEIISDSGSVIRVTVNHPVLTKNGWVNAGSLKQGDQLFKHELQREYVSVGNSPFGPTMRPTKKNDKPTRIEEVFSAISAVGVSECRNAKPADFHGDARSMQGDVEVVFAKGNLLPNGYLHSPKRRSDFVLEKPLFGGMSGVGLPCSLFGSHLRPLQILRFGATSRLNTVLLEMINNAKSTDAKTFVDGVDRLAIFMGINDRLQVKNSFPRSGIHPDPFHPFANGFCFASKLLGDLKNSQAAAVSIDKVASVNKIQFRGHVFDLQSVTGIVLAEGLLFSNCRCVVIPLSVEDAARYGSREAQRWLRTGESPVSPDWAARPYPIIPPKGWPTHRRIESVL